MKFALDLYKQLELNERSIINSFIYNALIVNSNENDFIIGYSQISESVPLLYSDSKYVYYRFLSFVRELRTFEIFDILNNKIFSSTILKYFDLAGKCIKNDLAFRYQFEEEFFHYIKNDFIQDHLIKRFRPVEDSHSNRIEFIDMMPEKSKCIVLALINNYYPNYLNVERKLYASDFSIKFDRLLDYAGNCSISLLELKSILNSFSSPQYWLYLFSKKIPNQSSLITNFFVFDFDNPTNPMITYKYSLEFLTLLRDKNFIKYFLSEYNIDASNFILLDDLFQ